MVAFKKFPAILFVCALIVAMSMTALAATGLTANEQAVQEKLQGATVIKSDAEAKGVERKTFSFSNMSAENRAAALDLGQKAYVDLAIAVSYNYSLKSVLEKPVVCLDEQ